MATSTAIAANPDMEVYVDPYRCSWLAPAPAEAHDDIAGAAADYFGLTDYNPSSVYAEQSDHYPRPAYTYDTSDDEDRGTPKVGLYAQDGLWDEDDSEILRSSTPNGSASASGTLTSHGGSTPATMRTTSSAHGRYSRSGTSSLAQKDDGEKGLWSWARKARGSQSPTADLGTTVTVTSDTKPIKKKGSMSMLRGKGRRGELSVTVAEDNLVPPVPQTPTTFLATPTTPSWHSPQIRRHDENDFSPAHPVEGKKGSWKRGVSKLFKSKSSVALRDITSSPNISTKAPAPPVPVVPSKIPQPQRNRHGKPFSASTPPAAAYQSGVSGADMSSPRAPPVGLFAECPDPFGSSITTAENDSFENDLPLPTRPRGPRHSPSLKSLRDLLSSKPKAKIAKAKSMANIKSAAPPLVVDEVPEILPLPPRPVSLVAPAPEPETAENASLPSLPPTPLQPPFESPPLMPPTPAFLAMSSRLSSTSSFGSSSSDSSQPLYASKNPGLTISTSFPSPSTLPPLPISAPTSPLPALPQPSMQAICDVPKSTSHVLLPRSRSTSMSLKSPPTSSSFFDLYEQLGIWPTPEKPKQEEEAKALEVETQAEETSIDASADTDASILDTTDDSAQAYPFTDDSQVTYDGQEGAMEMMNDGQRHQSKTGLSASSSAAFSSASWEAAINAFPDIPDVPESDAMADFAADLENDTGDLSVVSNVAVVALSPSTSQTHTLASSSVAPTRSHSQTYSHSHSQGQQGSTSTQQSGQGSGQRQSQGQGQASGSNWSRGRTGGLRGDGSGRSSRDDSRDRKRQTGPREGAWADHWSSSEDEDEDDEEESDDVPLSQLHPGAVIAQKERKARALARRDKRSKGKLDQLKLVGRNPGGDTNWNGEGGVPADVLRRKLERLMIPPTSISDGQGSARSTTPTSVYPWAKSGTSAGLEAAKRSRSREPAVGGSGAGAGGGHALPEQPMLQGRRPSAPTLPSMPRKSSAQAYAQIHATSGKPVVGLNIHTSPGTLLPPTLPSPAAFASQSASGTASGSGSASVSRRPTGSHSHHTTPRLPPIPSDAIMPAASGVSRSNTSTSKRSVGASPALPPQPSGSSRHRTRSGAAGPSSGNTAPHSRSATEPIPRSSGQSHHHVPPSPNVAQSRPVQIQAYIEQVGGKRVSYELNAESTVHDLLSAAARAGDIGAPPTSQMSWVVVELFGEMGCERYLREYELLQTVLRGWDVGKVGSASASGAGVGVRNGLCLRLTARGDCTWQRAIPQTAPFVGGWAQYESKQGKWSKRWLETRGGQVFMAKNEKNKDEVQINTLFCDVYQMTRPIDAPRPFVFVIKRMEPESAFENRDEWAHVFSMEEGVGFKLMSAIYDAKSFTLRPHLLARQGQLHRRPTAAANPGGPLVDLQVKKEEKTGAFAGKGLLRL